MVAKPRKKAVKKSRSVAITGVHTFLGQRLLRELAGDPAYGKIVAFDLSPPRMGEKVIYEKIDLSEPGADARMRDVLVREKVDTVLHAAFLGDPTRDEAYAHEVESIGTMYVLAAAAEAKVRKFVLCSSTLCYGADPLNPNYLTEAHPLGRQVASPYIAGKIDAEEQVKRFAEEHPKTVVTVLRPCTVVGPSIESYATRFLSRRVVTTILGFDPLVQLLHEDDYVAAFKLALDRDLNGVFNLAGDGVLKLSSVFRLTGALVVPVPYLVAFTTMKVLWAAELADAPPRLLDYLRYLCVADGKRGHDVFELAYSSKEALLDFTDTLKLRRVRARESSLSL